MNFFENEIINNLIISLIGIIIVYIVEKILKKISNKKIEKINVKHIIRQWLKYIKAIILILFLIKIWLPNTVSIGTLLGFTSAGIALALHQVILNLAGWIFILVRVPYKVGDRIEYNNIKGDIVDIQLFHTAIMEVGGWVKGDQSTGRTILIPNGKIFTENFTSYTFGFDAIWDEYSVLLTFNSDIHKAEEIILNIIKGFESKVFLEKIRNQQQEIKKKIAYKSSPLTPITYVEIKDSGVEINLRYVVPSRARRHKRSNINRKVLEEFSKHKDISFAYPSKSVYLENKGDENE